MRTIGLALLLLLSVCAIAQMPPCPNPDAPGRDFSGRNLTDANFSHEDLTNANFAGATLDGAQFVGARLVGANFSRASLKESSKGAASFLNADLTRACFQEAKLQDANLQFATVTCTDFSASDLTSALFAARPTIHPSKNCRTKFVGATMRIHQFPISLWRHTDFTNTNFVDLTPSSFSFRNADLTNAILAGAKLTGFDLTDSTLNGADFSSADLRGARLDGAKAIGVKMTNAKLSYVIARKAQFFDAMRPHLKSDFRGATAVDADFSEAILSSADLRGANFSATSFASANLDNALLQAGDGMNATQVFASDFSNATLRNTHLNGVSFQNARLVAAKIGGTLLNTDFSRAILTNAEFETNTILQSVSFAGSALQNVVFRNTSMRPSPGGGLGVNFSCAHLGGANFIGATLTLASFNAAVVPQRKDCCLQGGTYHCGNDPFTQSAYPPTSLPALTTVVTCPNGDQAVCSDTQWTVPGWRTKVCSTQGLTEQIWSPPGCGGDGGGETVNIPDPKFLECLQVALFGSAQDQKITTELAKTVGEISCPGRGITDVTGLRAFSALRNLDLSNNNITDGSVFSELRNLGMLKLKGNKLTQLRLSRLTNLRYLDASHNRIRGTIGGWVAVNLEYLDLSYNQLSGDLPIDDQDHLFFVDLSHNHLNDVGDDLSRLTSLVFLRLHNNALESIGSLKALSASGTLRHLSLACNPEFDCASLDLGGTQLLENSLCGKQIDGCHR